MLITKNFSDELEEQRMDDHKFYHQSKWNQTFHFFSALCFLFSEIWIFIDPILAAYISWASMIPRQAGHFFFEPKGFDHIHNLSHEYKESIKVGYNLFRKRLLLSSVFLIAPIVTFIYSESMKEMYINYGVLMLLISLFAILSRVLYLSFYHSPRTAAIWAFKIITDPINDIKLYWYSPIELMKGIKYEPGVKI